MREIQKFELNALVNIILKLRTSFQFISFLSHSLLLSSLMAAIDIRDIRALDNPAAFLTPFQFEITFDCEREIPDGKSNHLTIKRSVVCPNLIYYGYLF